MQELARNETVSGIPETPVLDLPIVFLPEIRFDQVSEDTTLVLVVNYESEYQVIGINATESRFRVEEISLNEISDMLVKLDVLTDDETIIAVFHVADVDPGSVYPFSNGEIYVRPSVDEYGFIENFAIHARNNPEFTVDFDTDNGWSVRPTGESKTVLSLQEIDESNPLVVGKEVFLLVDTDLDQRIPYSVHGGLSDLDWSAFTGSMIAMTQGSLHGFEYYLGLSSIEETTYSDCFTRDTNVELHTIVLTSKDETTAFFPLGPKAVTTKRH